MKTFIVILAVATSVTEARGDFPLSKAEAWQLGFVAVAALLTSLSNEASKLREGEKFSPPHFLGDAGLGVMAGIAAPLLISWIVEHFAQIRIDWRASVGLSILGAFVGRDFLMWAWGLLKSIGDLIAKLKGLKVSFDESKGGQDAGTQTRPPSTSPDAGNDFPATSDVQPLPDDARGGDGRA